MRKKKVIIIGAGLAGLSSAYILSRTHPTPEIVIVEARDRCGGRVETLREPFSDGLFAEAGAYFVSDLHSLVLKYVTRFNLALDPLVPDGTPSHYYLQGPQNQGQHFYFSGIPGMDKWPDFDPYSLMTEDEKKLGLYAMLGKDVFSTALREAGDAIASKWAALGIVELDNISFLDFLRRSGSSEGAMSFIRPWYEGWFGDLNDLSALAMLRYAAIAHNHESQWYTIRDGMDNLPRAFASRLEDSHNEMGKKACNIRYNSAVKEIKQEDKSVTVIYDNLKTGQRDKETGDYVICAVPLTTLRDIKVQPDFCIGKKKAIKEISYSSVCRVYLQCNKRLWNPEHNEYLGKAANDMKEKGVVYTNLDIMNIVDSTYAQKGPPGIIHAFMSGPQAQLMAAKDNDETLRFVLEEMKKVYGDMKGSYQNRFYIKNWDNDPWAKGAYPCFKPGQITSLMRDIVHPEGLVHFAGEHTSAWGAWMEGAIESGHRAATEVMQAP